jgi:hypothetical protein
MRRWAVVGLTVVFLGLAAGFVVRYWQWSRRPGAARYNFNRIEMGMTLEEVEAVMGEDPFADKAEWHRGETSPYTITWLSTPSRIDVHFDGKGIVVDKEFDEEGGFVPSWVGRPIQDFLGL